MLMDEMQVGIPETKSVSIRIVEQSQAQTYERLLHMCACRQDIAGKKTRGGRDFEGCRADRTRAGGTQDSLKLAHGCIKRSRLSGSLCSIGYPVKKGMKG